MANQKTEDSGAAEQENTRHERRAFITGVAAVAAAAIVADTTTVEATSGGGPDGAVIQGSNFVNSINTASNVTIMGPGATIGFPLVLDVEAAAGGTQANINAIYGHGKGSGSGVVGVTGGSSGTNSSLMPNAAVAGYHTGTGVAVLGTVSASNAMAVRGNIPATSSGANMIAVYGENFSTDPGGGPGAGGFGCYGFSAKGAGLVGATGTAGGAAVMGSTNGVAGAYAGIFYGPFVVVGGPKSAAVPHPDGSHRLLYCVESPESWFEDFGEGQLVCGTAEVKIDPDFAAVADMEKYHVFVTDHTNQHLSVTRRSPGGFTVKADAEIAALKGKQTDDLAGTFSWRLVAKRKDINAERLAAVALPPEPKRPLAPEPVIEADRQFDPTRPSRSV